MNRMSLIIRQKILSIVFIIISLAGGVSIFFYINDLKENIPENISYNQIFIARADIRKNEEIAAELLEEQKIPANIFGDKFIVDKNEIIGKTTAVDILEGEIITKDKLKGKSSGNGFNLSFSSYIPYDLRAVSIPVNFYGNKSLIKEGDKVDLISTYYEPASSVLYSETLLTEKEVILIESNLKGSYPENEGGNESFMLGSVADSGLLDSYSGNSLVITFYLSKSEAEEVFMATERGTVNLSICCRN